MLLIEQANLMGLLALANDVMSCHLQLTQRVACLLPYKINCK